MSENKKLAVVLTENKLDPTETQEEQKIFSPFFQEVEKMKDVCTSIVITDISQVAEMERAREYRLQLKKLRCSADSEKNRLKEVPLRKCQAIDALARYLKSEIMPLEAHLKEQEDYVVKKEEERVDKLEEARKEELDMYEHDYQFIDLRKLPEENYQVLLKNAKETFKLRQEKLKKEAEEKAKEEQEEAEKQEAVRKENEKLKKEAEEREKAIEEERRKEEAVRKKIEAENKAKLDKERKEKERLEAELKAKREEAERKAKEESDKIKTQEEARKKAEKEAELAPDRQKLEQLAVRITQLEMPKVKSKEAQEVIVTVVELLNKTSNYIKEKTINL